LSVLEDNLAALHALRPQLAFLVEKEEGTSAAEVLPTRSGHVTLRVPLPDGRRVTLHSTYDPVAEAKREAEKVELAETGVYLVLGLGLGYHVEALLERVDQQSDVVIVEESPALFRAACAARDLRPLLSDERVQIFIRVAPSEIYRQFRRAQLFLMTTGFKYLVLPRLTAPAPDYYQAVRAQCADFAISGEAAVRTIFLISRHSVENELGNLPIYVGGELFAELRERCAGRPGIVISAGPSLRGNMHDLVRAKGRAVTIACDVILKPLLAAGIEPDLVGMVDFQGHTGKFFAGLPRSLRTRLVATASAYHRTVSDYPGPVTFCRDPTMERLLAPFETGRTGAALGNNVGHFSFAVACQLGLNPIALVGQDLGYPANVTHLPGTPIHEEWQVERNRFLTLEMRELEELWRKRAKLMSVEDIHGREIFTDKTMYHYLRDLESTIDSTKGLKVFDATEGGSCIRGTELTTLREFLDDCPEAAAGPDAAGADRLDRERLAEAAKVLAKRMLDLLDMKAICENKDRLHVRIERALEEGRPFENHVRRLTELERRAEELGEIWTVISNTIPQDLMQAINTQRRTMVAGLEGEEETREKLKRDKAFVKAVIEGIGWLEPRLREARKRLDRAAEGAE